MNEETIISISEAIHRGKCILVLGPEIGQVDHEILGTHQACDFEESLKLAYEYYINKKIDRSISSDENSKLIEFGEAFSKEKLWVSNYKNDQHLLKFAQWYFEHAIGWEQTFEKLTQLCFPLIISLLPDTYLERTFEKKGRAFYLSRYSRINKPDVQAINFSFTKQKPLIYKLLGDIKARDASFTFDHWFEFFRNLFREAPSLPEPVINSLKDAELILFVGVRVEKWYIQLLVKYLYEIINENPESLAYAKIKEHQDTKLATKRLSIVFDEKEPSKLIDELFVYAQAKQWLYQATSDKQKIDATVFISYNHADASTALNIKAALAQYGINVIIDTDNPIGFEIPRFINESIAQADFILQLISENFLTSAWVAQESITAFNVAEVTGKVVLPCTLDASLTDTLLFRQRAMSIFDAKLKALRDEMTKRLENDASTEDLEPQRRRLLQLKNNYDSIIAAFQNKNRGDLSPENYTQGLANLISSIQTYQSKKQ